MLLVSQLELGFKTQGIDQNLVTRPLNVELSETNEAIPKSPVLN